MSIHNLGIPAATFVDLLRVHAQRHPDRLAFTFLHNGETDEARLTYGQLDAQARAIAVRLQTGGLAGQRVLLLYPPGLEYVAAFAGCLYAGTVAVPAYPPRMQHRSLERLHAIVEDAQAAGALTTTPMHADLMAHSADFSTLTRLRWLTTGAEIPADVPTWHPPALDEHTLAFLQYTSGSTSTPKGVMLTHKNLLHNLALIQRSFGTSTDSRGVFWLPLYHDMGLIGGVLQTLYCGGSSTLMSPTAFLQRPLRWLQAISQTRATISGGPNFAYELCVRRITPELRATLDLSSWSVAFNGAEPVRAETFERFAAAFEPCGFRRSAFYPCYGLAEATLLVAGGQHAEPPFVRSFAGAALEQNQLVAAADEESGAITLVGYLPRSGEQRAVIAHPETLTVCPPNQVGEIWVAGPSTAQGYWNRPEETAQTFHARLAGSGEGPFLRTGDLGFLWEGRLFITGRLKDLILIRGRNHYPQDIELTLEQSHPALRPTSGAAFTVELDGEAHLVLVQEVERQHRHQDLGAMIHAIRHNIAEQHELQAYGVVLIRPGGIPKTSSGKVQRRACCQAFLAGTLPVLQSDVLAPSSAPLDDIQLRPPMLQAIEPAQHQTLTEQYLRAQLAHALRCAPELLDLRVPLSALGLDSLTFLQLSHAIESDLGVALPTAALFQNMTIPQLAERLLELIDRAEPALSRSSASAPPPESPLSFGQRALWFLHELDPERLTYNIARAVRICGALDLVALRQAFQVLTERHPALRTIITSIQGEPLQRVIEQMPLDFAVVDAAAWDAPTLQSYLAGEAYRPFRLERGPLLRVRLCTGLAGEHVLLLVAHHIISDFWSLAVLLDELRLLYPALAAGAAAPALPQLTQHYADYVQWQADMLGGPEGQRLRAYWERKLAGPLPVLQLPTGRPRPPVQTYRGATQRLKLDASLTQQLKSFSQAQNVTLYTTLLAAFQVLLHRHTGQDDVLVGSPTAGRSSVRFANLVGYFVNPVVLQARCAGNPPFRAFLRQVQHTVQEAFAHEVYPFVLLVEQLMPERDQSQTPIFQAMFIMQKAHVLDEAGLTAFALGDTEATMQMGELKLEALPLERQVAEFDLTLIVAENQGSLRASLQYNADLFDAEQMAAMAGRFALLLEGIAANPECRVSALPLLPSAERRQLLEAWNATQVAYPLDRCLQHWFEDQVERTPDAVAVVGPEQTLTYAALNARANQLAHHLQSLHVGPETLVGICLDRSSLLVVALLGILKAGGAYLPLDPSYPQERLAFMLEDARIRVLLTTRRGEGERGRGGDIGSFSSSPPLPLSPSVVDLDADWETLARQPAGNLESAVSAQNAAYVLYTSGSTGRPKGVLISHRAISNHMRWMQETFALTAADRVLQKTPVSFDASVWEFYAPLLAGAQLILAQPDRHQDSSYLVRAIVEHQVSILQVVPTMLRSLLEEPGFGACSSLRQIFCGGEALPADLVAQCARLLPAKLCNLYGPTEATIDATSWVCDATDAQRAPPIGRPIANMRAYILDATLQPAPIGVVGELYLGGVGLARGYLNRPDLTAERFIPNPFLRMEDGGWRMEDGDLPSSILHPPSARLYRTGDLASYRADGTIVFLGRADRQVKMRGYRIELGEVEAVLHLHSDVHEAVVIAREDAPGDRRLVAYVVPRDWRLEIGDSSGDNLQSPISNLPQELRQFLRDRLPDYMIPSAFVLLDALPLTPNGKVDRKALPAFDWGSLASETTYAPPRNPIEETLAAIWSDVLGRKRVGVLDHFFALGGHSLLATRIIARIGDVFRVELPVRALFETPTIAQIAESIAALQHNEATPPAPPLVPLAPGQHARLSFAQERLWFLDRLEPGNPFYNQSFLVRLTGRLTITALEQALQAIVCRHASLRTRFALAVGQPVQLAEPTLPLELAVIDVGGTGAEESETEVQCLAIAQARQPFDLQRGPLLRASLLRQSDTAHVLLITLHHIITDGWSQLVLMREIVTLYQAFADHTTAPLPELPVQYADFAHWQRQWLKGELIERQLAYWRRQLAQAAPLLHLPTDYPRPALQRYQGRRQTFAFSPSLSEALKDLSRREGVTLFMMLLAALQVLLHRYSGQSGVSVGTPAAGRDRVELEGVVGFFLNMLVIHVDLRDDPPFRTVLERVREATLGAYTHQHLPFDMLVQHLRIERNLIYPSLFQVMFNLQNHGQQTVELPGLTFRFEELDSGTAKYDLTFALGDNGLWLEGGLEYNTDLFDAATITRMLSHWEVLLEAVVVDPARRISTLALLPADELRQLATWAVAGTPPGQAGEVGVYQSFSIMARQRPDACALVAGGQHLTYADLERRVEWTARALRSVGVGPETIVGLRVAQPFDLAVGLLGILAAGAACLPLDPALSAQQAQAILTAGQATALITSQEPDISTSSIPIVRVDGATEVSAGDAAALAAQAAPRQLACVVWHTQPGGSPSLLAFEQSELSVLVAALAQAVQVRPGDRVLIAAGSTAVAIPPLLMALLAGTTLHLPTAPDTGAALAQDLREQAINLLIGPPTLLDVLPAQPYPELRAVLALGQSCAAQIGARWSQHCHFVHAHVLAGGAIWAGTRPDSRHLWRYLIERFFTPTEVYLLDAQLQPLPIGVPGDVYVGGAGTARGYLKQPDLTAEHFVPNPFLRMEDGGWRMDARHPPSSILHPPSSRLYRTGDLARYLADGSLEWLGARADQTLIHGLLVLPQQIYHVLGHHPTVREVAVRTVELASETRLVAYVVPGQEQKGERLFEKGEFEGAAPQESPFHPGLRATNQPFQIVSEKEDSQFSILNSQFAAELRAFMQRHLPDYLVPEVVLMASLPRLPDGQLDVAALPGPSAGETAQELAGPPRAAGRSAQLEQLSAAKRALLDKMMRGKSS